VMPSGYDPACVFCRIARGEEPATVVAEGDEWIAIFPNDPATPGHTLVVPRQHVEDLWQTPVALSRELMAACVRVGRAIQAALEPEGMNLITSAGRVAEQTVFHLHLHVVPRWSDDQFGKIWPRDETYEREDLAGLIDSISRFYKNGE
jgi:histidine triad (HIT) family protein